MGWSKDPGPSLAGQTPAFFISMNELSVFVDENGDPGAYDYHSPYCNISFVFHGQDKDIENDLEILDQNLEAFG